MRKSVVGSVGLAIASIGLIAAARTGTHPRPAVATSASQAALDRSILQVQVVLDHLGFSPGVMDGRPGMSLTAALKGFQESRGLQKTGQLDDATRAALQQYGNVQPTVTLRLTADVLAGPYTNPLPHDPAQQALLPALGYRSPMEKLAEMFHTTPQVLVELNSASTPLTPGTPVVFPNALPFSRNYPASLPATWRATLNGLNVDAQQPRGARVVVDKSDSVLRVLDDQGRLVAQFQATMGSEHDPLPLGRWTINGPSYNPPFNYNPALFWDARAGQHPVRLPPGPNGPVGVIWLDLSREHYGIHGTPEPSTIGRAESHGCIRLTNWDAARLSLMVRPGTPAVFQE